jgi:hypothetical protein
MGSSTHFIACSKEPFVKMSNKYKRKGGAEATMGFVEGIEKYYETTDWALPKYIQFIRRALEMHYKVWLYDYPKSPSKYVTVRHGKKLKFLVRFSNHKPIEYLEQKGTCDFFVGVTNQGVTTTEMAWTAMMERFGRMDKWKGVEKNGE